MKNQKQKGISSLFGIIIVIIAAILAVGGVLAYQYWLAPKEEVKAPGEGVEDETANWKIYTNNDYGFEIKYPSTDWEAKYNSPNGFLFFRKDNEEAVTSCFSMGCAVPVISIVFQPYDSVESFWLWEIIGQKPEKKPPLKVPFDEKIKKEVVFIGNQKVIKVDTTDPNFPNWQNWYYVIDSPKIRSLVIFSVETNEKEPISYEFIVEKMLSTFRFLE